MDDNDSQWEATLDQAQAVERALYCWHKRSRQIVLPECLQVGLLRSAQELSYAENEHDIGLLQLSLSYSASVLEELQKWLKEN